MSRRNTQVEQRMRQGIPARLREVTKQIKATFDSNLDQKWQGKGEHGIMKRLESHLHKSFSNVEDHLAQSVEALRNLVC